MITLKKAKGIVFIAVSLLIASLLTACPDAGAGAAAAAGDGNGGDPDPFVRADATVASTTVAWSSQSPASGSLATYISGAGPYTLTVPDGLHAIHAVVVGGGGAAYLAGGGAGYIRAGGFTVEPGEALILTVGAGGATYPTLYSGGSSSIKKGSEIIMQANGGAKASGSAGGAGAGGGGQNGHGGYCANGGGTGGGTGGNNPAQSSGLFGTPPANCTDSKSNVKYGAGGGGGQNSRGGTGGSATGAGSGGGNGTVTGTAGADHYGAGGGGSVQNSHSAQGAGGKGVIVLYVD